MNVALNSNLTAGLSKPAISSAPSNSVPTSTPALAGTSVAEPKTGSIATRDQVQLSPQSLEASQQQPKTGGPLQRPTSLVASDVSTSSANAKTLAQPVNVDVLPAPQAPALDPVDTVTEVAQVKHGDTVNDHRRPKDNHGFKMPKFTGKAGEYGQFYIRMKALLAHMKHGPQQRSIGAFAGAQGAPAATNARSFIGDVQAKPSVFTAANTKQVNDVISDFAANASKFIDSVQGTPSIANLVPNEPRSFIAPRMNLVG